MGDADNHENNCPVCENRDKLTGQSRRKCLSVEILTALDTAGGLEKCQKRGSPDGKKTYPACCGKRKRSGRIRPDG